MKAVRIRPVEGRLILMPEHNFTQAVPAEGVLVYLDSFYSRAIAQGDLEAVEYVDPDAPAKADTPPAPAPSAPRSTSKKDS